jgi:hypothetical protein
MSGGLNQLFVFKPMREDDDLSGSDALSDSSKEAAFIEESVRVTVESTEGISLSPLVTGNAYMLYLGEWIIPLS